MKARIAWKAFGKEVRECRIRHGAGLRELGRTLGIDKATLSRAENGKPINPALFIWLAGWSGHTAEEYLAPLYTKRR